MNQSEIIDAVKYLISGSFSPFVPGDTYISPHGADINNNDVAALVECAISRWYTEGKYSKEFSKKLRTYLGNRPRFVTLCNSGSSANLLAITAMTAPEFGERRLLPGDEVITTAVGFPTTVNAIFQTNAHPVFVDVGLGDYVPKVEDIEEAITEGKTKAIVLAHTLGNPFDVEAIRDLCDEYNLFLLEDTCDALGSTVNDRFVGTWGDFATISFYPAHHITGGEGGAVLSNSPMVDKVVKSFRDWGRDCWCGTGKDNTCGKRFEHNYENLPYGYDHKYVYSRLGYNLKITDLQASLLCSQIDRLPDFAEKRRYNFIYLWEKMQEFEDWMILPKPTYNSDPSWFGFPITLKTYACSFGRKELIDFLDSKKIGTRMLFGSNLTQQPAYKGLEYTIHGNLYNSDIITTHSFWIGVHPNLTIEMLDYVVDSFREFFKDKK